MRIRALVACAIAAIAMACGGTNLFRQYEYEEDMFLSLDGSASLTVSSSIDALNALRGTHFDRSRVDRDAVRAYFTAPGQTVRSVSTSRRSGRRFVHVRVDVDDVRKMSESPAFAWSKVRFDREDDAYVFKQTVGPSAGGAGAARDDVPSISGELVAFRLHLPSKIEFHNSGRPIGRGNILTWEQPLGDRLHGVPLTLEARMQTQSILYRTLWLFGSTVIAVVALFAALLWWVVRKGRVGPVGRVASIPTRPIGPTRPT